MMAFFLLCVMHFSDSPSTNRDIYVSRLGLRESSCITETLIPQSYYPWIEFLEIDTGCVSSSVPTPGIRFMFIGIDSSSRIFKIFGCDSSQFSEMVSRYPITLEIDQVQAYGQFCIDLTVLASSEEHYFVPNADSLLKLNRPATRSWDISEKAFRRKSESIDRRIENVCHNINFDVITYDKLRDKFNLDYYVWYLRSGELRNIAVEIDRHGGFVVRKDSVVATKLGYYNPIGM